MLITLLRHSDRVTIANQAQLVNVIAPIMTEPGGAAWKQTIFHPFAITSRNAVGEVLQTRVSATTIGTPVHGAVPQVDAVCTWDSDSNRLALFAVNRSPSETVVLEVDVTPFGRLRVSEALVLSDEDPHARNTPEEPDRVRVQPLGDAASVDGGRLRVELPAVAWASVCLSLQ
jgi:alpha-N-arabinofuranosidase